MSMIKNLLLSVITSTALICGASSVALASAASSDLQDVCKNNSNSALCVGYEKGLDASPSDNAMLKLFTRIINILFFAAGVLAVFMVILGGFKYVTSAGDAQKAASGRQTLIFALIGLVVVVVSRQLLLFVLERLLK